MIMIYTWIIYRLLCTATQCRESSSLRERTFFERARVALQTITMIMYWWCRQYPVLQPYKEAGDSKTIAIEWHREVCSFLNHDILHHGGTGPANTNSVQIDESCFSHKPKVSTHHLNQAYYSGTSEQYHLWNNTTFGGKNCALC